jgi:hypothetical protein
MVRTSKAAPAAPDPKIVLPEADGEVTLPGEVVDPLVIGPASAPMTPGWLMGIGSRAETAGEHAARLGASAGKFNDAGFLLGNLESRDNWPATPVEPEPEP